MAEMLDVTTTIAPYITTAVAAALLGAAFGHNYGILAVVVVTPAIVAVVALLACLVLTIAFCKFWQGFCETLAHGPGHTHHLAETQSFLGMCAYIMTAVGAALSGAAFSSGIVTAAGAAVCHVFKLTAAVIVIVGGLGAMSCAGELVATANQGEKHADRGHPQHASVQHSMGFGGPSQILRLLEQGLPMPLTVFSAAAAPQGHWMHI